MTSPAFSFYAKDWLAATLAWTLEARGAYMTLLAYQWDAGSIPASAAAIARILGISETKTRKIWPIISTKFVQKSDGGWINSRLEIEREKQHYRAARSAENGRNGGRPHNPVGNPEITQWVSETEPRPNPEKSLSSSSASSSALHSPLTPQRGTQKKTMTRFASLGGRN